MSLYLKALYGSVAAGLGALEAAYVAHGGAVVWGDAIPVAIAAVAALGVIWGVPNAQKT